MFYRIVGGFLTLSPELCMVVEDESGIVGYALAALNAKTFNQKLAVAWIPEMKLKYPFEDWRSDLPEQVQVIFLFLLSFESNVY